MRVEGSSLSDLGQHRVARSRDIDRKINMEDSRVKVMANIFSAYLRSPNPDICVCDRSGANYFQAFVVISVHHPCYLCCNIFVKIRETFRVRIFRLFW